ncbi:MAG TPA: hypothetical protein DER01_13165 [Phycisphaerales bacterium]|nr:hypothetical protein [Phycisphaerales bacterium]
MTEQDTTQTPDASTPVTSAIKMRSGKLCIPAIGAMGALVPALIFAAVGNNGLTRFMFAYIISYAFFLSISLGALFFICIQHVSRAAWSVTSRRIAEVLAMTMPVLAIAFLPIAGNVMLGGGDVYPWAASHEHHAPAYGDDHAQPAHGSTTDDHAASDNSENNHAPLSASDAYAPEEKKVADAHQAVADHSDHSTTKAKSSLHAPAVSLEGHGHIPGVIDAHTEAIYTAKKAAYLNVPFFIIRWIIFFAVWIGLSFAFWKKSVQQDTTGDVQLTRQMERLAPLGICLFAVTVTYAAFDMIMSMSPAWFSTIFGVYYFTGGMLSIFATLIVVLTVLRNKGLIDKTTVSKEHMHDHGKFLFGFVVFWAYIAFSQYMLIWYASLPETTFWFVARGATTVAKDMNSWSIVSIGLMICHFFIPFIGLMSRHIKRTNQTLVFWAVWLLVFHWIDLWWLIMPEMSVEVRIGIVEICCLIGLGGLFTAAAVWVGSLNALVPQKDPRIAESLAFKNL